MATAATAADTRIISADALEKLSDDLSVLATADEFRGHMVVSYKPALLGQAVSSMLPANGCAMAIRVAEPAESWRLVSNAFYGATERHFIARGVDGRCYELVSVNNVAVFREMTTELPPFLAESSGCKLDASQLTAPLALPMYPPLPPSYLFICQDQNVALTSDRNPRVTNPEDPALFPKALSVKATTPEGTAQLAQFFGQTLPAIAFNRWYEVEYVVGTGILNKDAFVILVNPTSATVSKLLEDSTASLLWSRLEIPSNACSLFSASVVVLKMVSMRKRSVAAVYRLPWSDPYYKLKDGGDISIKAWAARELMPLVIAGAAGAATIKIERRKMTLRISTDPNGPPMTLGGDNDSVDMFFHQIVPVYARTRLYDFEYSVEIQETRMLKNSTIARYLVLVNPTKPTLEALALRKDVLPPFVSKVNKGIKETVESDYYQILRGTSVAVFKSSSKANGGKFLLHGHAKYSSSLRGDNANGSKGSNSKSNGSPSAPEAPVDGSVDTDANVRAELDVMPEDMADAMPISFFDKLTRLMARTATAIKSYQSDKAQKKREVSIKRTRFQAIQR